MESIRGIENTEGEFIIIKGRVFIHHCVKMYLRGFKVDYVQRMLYRALFYISVIDFHEILAGLSVQAKDSLPVRNRDSLGNRLTTFGRCSALKGPS